MDRINELLAQLQELSNEQIAELESGILAEFDNVEKQDLTPQSVEMLQSLANGVEAVRNESARRAAEAEQLASAAAEAATRVRGGSDDAPAPGDPPLPDVPTDALPSPSEPNTGPPEGTPVDVPIGGQDEEARKRRQAIPTGAPQAASNDSESDKANELTATVEETADTSVDTPAEAEASTDGEAAEGEEHPVEGKSAEEIQQAAADAHEGGEKLSEQIAEAETKKVEEGTGEPLPEPTATGDDTSGTATQADGTTPSTGQTTPSTGQTAPSTGTSTTTASGEPDTNHEASEAAVTAAANGPEDQLVIEPPADRVPVPKATATVAITAGADIPGVSAGSKLDSMDSVADSFVKRLHGLRRVNGGDGEQHIVASLVADFPEERVLSGESEDNYDKIQKVIGPEALVASGGWCAPLEVRYDLFDTGGSTARPVKDSLPTFGADRGGIRYMTPPALGAYAAGIALWTAANDVDPGHDTDPGVGVVPSGPTVKPCVEVECGSEVTALVDAITLCLQFGNLMTRAYPELVRRHNELALVQHARFAENNLLEQMEAGSTAVTAAKELSAVRDWLKQLDKASAAYRHRRRLESNSPLRVIAPAWMRDLLRADIAMQMPGDGLNETLGIAESTILAWARARGVNITWHLDGAGWGAQGAGALLEFPTSVEWFLFEEGTWLFLDGGTLDLGIIRDSGLVGTNDYKMFVETFEGLAKMGPESLHITSNLRACGQAAALVATCA